MSQPRGLVDALGGFNNIVTITPCVTQLRCEVSDSALVDDGALRAAGAHGVVVKGALVQVVVGPMADDVAHQIEALR